MTNRIFYFRHMNGVFSPPTDSLPKLALVIAMFIQIVIVTHGSFPL
ncbi:hypothetical protein VM94_02915 [Janthinobacterium sp. KBS0711]|nr:hypothetical protein VM94_02915 [Janthinobacterium sp. KBS0711]